MCSNRFSLSVTFCTIAHFTPSPNGTETEDPQDQVPLAKLSNVPEFPPHYLERPEELQALKARVLVQTNQRVVVTGRTRRVGVQGMGGIGKTVLATALARDEEVRRAFPDGVFWLTVGQTPELTALQLQLAKALSPDRQQPFTNQEDGAAWLREFLADKTCLLLLDDVWLPKHLKAFEALGQNCQMLITTRNHELITASGAIDYPLDVLSHGQALRLLALWADQEVGENLPPEAHSVATECGHLPLALAMIGAMVRGKPDRWRNVLHKLQSADLERIRQDFPHYPYPNLLAAIQVSVNDLEPQMRSRYLDLAVFPEDTPIPEVVLQTLWEPQGLDRFDSQDVVDQLVGRSLTQKDESGYLTLHDLQLDYVRQQCDDLTRLHEQLLEVYRRKTKEGLWHTLPDDGYIHARLTWHLEKAGWVDEIHKLLCEETQERRNGWYEACERLGQATNFVTDVARAWQLAAEMFKDRPSQAISLQCRYALITASLKSLAANLREGLLVALVNKNVWSPRQGLAYALQIPVPYQKVKSLTALAKCLPQNLKEQALRSALQSVWAIQSEDFRALALSALVNELPAEVMPEALQVARAIHSMSARALALSAIVDKQPSVLSETLQVVWTIQSESSRVVALKALVDKLPAELVTEALRQVWMFQSEVPRADALRALVDKLPAELLPEALQGARAIHSKWARVRALSAFVNKEPSLLSETLQTVRAIQHEWARANALTILADKLPAKLMPEALEVAKAIQSEDYRAEALGAISAKLPAELIPEALQAVRAIQNNSARVRALSTIANKLPYVLPEVLQTVRAMQNNWDCQAIQVQENSVCADALTTIADNLPADLVPEALQSLRAMQDDWARVRVLNALTNKLSAELMPEILQIVRAIENEKAFAEALNAIGDNLPAELIPQALQSFLQSLRAIQHESIRARALSGIAINLPSVLPEALQAIKVIQNEEARAYALSDLPFDLMPEALQVAWAIQSEWDRAKALRTLIPHLLQMPANQLLFLWGDTLHSLSLRTRPSLLQDLQVLVPVILALGGQAAVVEVACAIQDVIQWWP